MNVSLQGRGQPCFLRDSSKGCKLQKYNPLWRTPGSIHLLKNVYPLPTWTSLPKNPVSEAILRTSTSDNVCLSWILHPEKHQAILISWSNFGGNKYSIMQNNFNAIVLRIIFLSSLLVEIKYWLAWNIYVYKQ